MSGLLFTLKFIAIGIAAGIGGICIVWLLFKLIDRIFGEYASLKPFDYVEGLVEDFFALFEDMPEDWRDRRRWRREMATQREETDRKNQAIIAERERQEQAEREKQARSGPTESLALRRDDDAAPE